MIEEIDKNYFYEKEIIIIIDPERKVLTELAINEFQDLKKSSYNNSYNRGKDNYNKDKYFI